MCLPGILNTSDEEWLGVVARVEVGAVYRVGGRGLETDGSGGGFCVESVDGSQGAAQLKIGGVVFFVDVELVLNVEGDIVVWSPPDSFNLHLVSGQEWTYPAGRSWS